MLLLKSGSVLIVGALVLMEAVRAEATVPFTSNLFRNQRVMIRDTDRLRCLQVSALPNDLYVHAPCDILNPAQQFFLRWKKAGDSGVPSWWPSPAGQLAIERNLTEQCMNVPNGDTVNFARLQNYPCGPYANSTLIAGAPAGGGRTLQFVHSQKCITSYWFVMFLEGNPPIPFYWADWPQQMTCSSLEGGKQRYQFQYLDCSVVHGGSCASDAHCCSGKCTANVCVPGPNS